MIKLFRLFIPCLSAGDNDDDDNDDTIISFTKLTIEPTFLPMTELPTRLSIELPTELNDEKIIEITIDKTIEPKINYSDDLFKLFNSESSRIKKLPNLFYSNNNSIHLNRFISSDILIKDEYVNSYYKKLYPRTYSIIKKSLITTPSFHSQDPNDYRASLP